MMNCIELATGLGGNPLGLEVCRPRLLDDDDGPKHTPEGFLPFAFDVPAQGHAIGCCQFGLSDWTPAPLQESG